MQHVYKDFNMITGDTVLTVIDTLNNYYGGRLKYSIMYIYCMGIKDCELNIPLFEDQVRELDQGYVCSSEECSNVFKQMFQINDLLLVADVDEGKLQRADPDRELYSDFMFVMQVFDAPMIEVSSTDENLMVILEDKLRALIFPNDVKKS